MDCKQVDKILMDYIYEEIDPAEAETIESHLKACPRCAAEVESFQSTRDMMGELEELAPPVAVTQLLMEEARRAAPDQQSLAGRLRGMLRVLVMHPALAAAAMLVAVLGVSFFAYRQGLPPARQQVPRSDLPLTLDPGHHAALQAPATAGEPDDYRQEATKSPLRYKQEERPLGGQQPAKPQGLLGRLARDQNMDRKEKSGFRTSGPAPMKVGLRGKKRARVDRTYREPKTAYPPAQAAPSRDGTYDDLRGASAAAEVAKARPRPKRKPAAEPSRLRRQTRRAALNASNVGSGSTGVWSGRRNRQVASKPASTRSSARAGKLDDTASPVDKDAEGEGKGARSPDRANLLFASGAQAARSGKCQQAFIYFEKALAQRPSLIEKIARELGPCVGQLRSNKQHQVLANRVERSRARRAKRAAKARKASKKARKKAPAAAE